jgi:Response regulators consisting of a CheY-like receiver domain and a winged-helix DNA-binding domain
MNTSKGYLLVVEDIPDILNLMETTLKFKGYRVITAKNGQDALETAQKEPPLIIITDILMPKMDGFSLVHKLRMDPKTRSIPVVFLSATYVAPEDKAFALTIGATRFLEKPIDLNELLPAIEELLENASPSAAIEPINEIDFYQGYRKRLKIKFDDKAIQITRTERLLETLSEQEKPSFLESLRLAINEREQIQLLLNQIQELLEENLKPGY